MVTEAEEREIFSRISETLQNISSERDMWYRRRVNFLQDLRWRYGKVPGPGDDIIWASPVPTTEDLYNGCTCKGASLEVPVEDVTFYGTYVQCGECGRIYRTDKLPKGMYQFKPGDVCKRCERGILKLYIPPELRLWQKS